MNSRTQSKRNQLTTSGFVLIYTLLFMGILLVVFGTILNSAVNELRSSGDEVESLKAFYAADTAIECVRYYQEKSGAFNTTAPATQYNCGVGSNFSAGRSSGATTCGTYTYNFSLTGFSNGTCADVQVDVAQNANDPKLCDMAVVATGKNSCSGGTTIERTRWEGWVGLPVGSGNLTSGLVGYWPFDESSGTIANDTSPGNNNDGTLTNGPTWIASAGVSGSAVQMDGVDDYVTVPSSTNYSGTTGTWTGWIRTTQAVNLVSIMSRADASGTCSGITLYTANGAGGNGSNLRVTIHPAGSCGGSDVLDIGGGGTLNNGTWHHFALTFEGQNTANLYIDGALIASGVPSGAWSFGANPLRIGNALNAFWKNMNGSLDQIRIYNRVLTPAEITQLYNSRI